jgi:hypothetical protein
MRPIEGRRRVVEYSAVRAVHRTARLAALEELVRVTDS